MVQFEFLQPSTLPLYICDGVSLRWTDTSDGRIILLLLLPMMAVSPGQGPESVTEFLSYSITWFWEMICGACKQGPNTWCKGGGSEETLLLPTSCSHYKLQKVHYGSKVLVGAD